MICMQRYHIVRVGCFMFMALLLSANQVWAVEQQKRPQEPIHIEADRMVSRQQDKAVVFSGQVQAKQGEILIHGEEMTVYYNDTDDTASSQEVAVVGGVSQIDRIIITGKVEIIRQGLVATGDEAEYMARSSEVVLTGHAKILQENNMVTGHIIKMNMDLGTTEIVPDISSGERVVGYFYPSTSKAAGGKDKNPAIGIEKK